MVLNFYDFVLYDLVLYDFMTLEFADPDVAEGNGVSVILQRQR